MRHTRASDRATAEWRARSTWVFGCGMGWVEAPYLSLADTRRIAVAELCPPLERVVLEAWADELPEKEHPNAARQVKAGVLDGCADLTRDVHAAPLQSTINSMFPPVPYWEPPISPNEPVWPLHQLRAYRWTAALLACSVRDALELLHALYTSDESMPALNRGIRNTTHACLRCVPALGWRLSRISRCMRRAATLCGKGLPLSSG
jgi:hypothetical protein